MPFSGADLMADGCKETRFCAIGGFRLVAREAECAFGLNSRCDVATNALNLGARFTAYGRLSPGDPAR